MKSVRGRHRLGCKFGGVVQRLRETGRDLDLPKRLRLPDERVSVPEGNERARAAALPPAGGRAAPASCLAPAQQERWKATYKRARVRGKEPSILASVADLSNSPFNISTSCSSRGNEAPVSPKKGTEDGASSRRLLLLKQTARVTVFSSALVNHPYLRPSAFICGFPSPNFLSTWN